MACLATLASLTADAQQSNYVTVRVLSDGQSCVVDTQRMRCDAVGTLLRDDRHLAFSNPINITSDDSRAQALKIRDYLAKVGYSKIVVVSFITEPGSTSGTRP